MANFAGRLRRGSRLLIFASSLGSLVVGFLAWSGLLVLLDLYDSLSPIKEAEIYFWLMGVITVSLISFLVLFIRTLLKRPSTNQLANKVEAAHPQLKDPLNSAIEIEGLSIRWRKQDLDRLIKKLPLVSPSVREADRPRLLKLNSSQINEIAEQVARRIDRAQPNTRAKLVSINDACAVLGIGRTSVYKLIKDGALQARRIGRRTLLLREELEALLNDSNRA